MKAQELPESEIERRRQMDILAREATARDRLRCLELNKSRAVYYYGKNDAIRQAIKATILKLPYHAQQFAFQCRYLSIPAAAAGYSFPGEVLGSHWVVLISELTPLAQMETAIVHEIAHGFLKHPTDSGHDEEQAESLCREWGFQTFISVDLDEWLARVKQTCVIET